jgi:hypothetical protein
MASDLKHITRDVGAFSVAAILALVALFLLSWVYTEPIVYLNSETEANLPILKQDTHYDVLMMGISHARIFSRHRNHERFESTTGKSMINLSQGGGFGGLDNQLLHLNYFLYKGNSADQLILVLSPMLMFNRNTDRTRVAFEREPFDPEFFRFVAEHGVENRYQQLGYYLRSKLFWNWITARPTSLDRMDKQIDGLDSAAMARTMPGAYPYGLDPAQFADRSAVAQSILKVAHSNGMRIIVVMPASLFGKWPGHDETMAWLETVRDDYNLRIVDLSERWVMRTEYFYDHHHLNTDGVMKAVDVIFRLERSEKHVF